MISGSQYEPTRSLSTDHRLGQELMSAIAMFHQRCMCWTKKTTTSSAISFVTVCPTPG
jgi:hypothetical protein